MASQGHEMHCRDLEFMDSNPGGVEFGVRSRLLQSKSSLNQKYNHLKTLLMLDCNIALE